MIPAPFWKGGVNANILLWVPFTGGSMADISIYNRTPTLVVTGGAATVTPGLFEIDITSASPVTFQARINYPIPPAPWAAGGGAIPANVPFTFEGFVRWNVTPNNTGPFDIFHFDPAPTNPPASVDIRTVKTYANAGDIQYDDSAFGIQAGPTTTHPLAPTNTLYHWAWVIEAGPGTITNWFYVNGVSWGSYSIGRSSGYLLTADGQFSIGGNVNTGASPNHVKGALGETRASRANLYPNGTSFTPPTPGNLPPVP